MYIHNFDSESYLAELDDNFELISTVKLISENGNSAFEDVRLFSFGEFLLGFYSYFPKNDQGGWDNLFGVGLGIIDLATGTIKNQLSLRFLSRRLHEKNWVPYIYNDELYLITDFDPYLRIIKITNLSSSLKASDVFTSSDLTKSWEYGEIRGGTPLISCPSPEENCLFGFVHSYLPDHEGFDRFYYFTAVKFNPETNEFRYHPKPLSYPDNVLDEDHYFLWEDIHNKSVKVIFPIGIISVDNGILVSFGIDDVRSYTEFFSWDFMTGLFEAS